MSWKTGPSSDLHRSRLIVLVLSLLGAALGAPPEAVGAEPATPTVVASPSADYPWPMRFRGQRTPESPHWDLELLYIQSQHDEGVIQTRAKLAKNPSDPELYWMLVRFLYEVGERIPRDDKQVDKVKFYEDMVDLSNQGLAIDPKHVHLRFARGIATARLGTTRGVLSSLFTAKEIEDDWLYVAGSDYTYATPQGEEVLPCDAHEALGVFYRLVPDWWIVSVLSGTRGSLSKSIHHHELANQCSGGRIIRERKELAVSQICFGQHNHDDAMIQSGVENLKFLLTLPPVSDTDRVDVKHAHMLLKDLSLACEYSRDGQQDIDESALPSK